MDSFKEQIVRKIPTKNDKIQKIFIMIASVALAALCFIFPFGTQFSVIGIFSCRRRTLWRLLSYNKTRCGV